MWCVTSSVTVAWKHGGISKLASLRASRQTSKMSQPNASSAFFRNREGKRLAIADKHGFDRLPNVRTYDAADGYSLIIYFQNGDAKKLRALNNATWFIKISFVCNTLRSAVTRFIDAINILLRLRNRNTNPQLFLLHLAGERGHIDCSEPETKSPPSPGYCGSLYVQLK